MTASLSSRIVPHFVVYVSLALAFILPGCNNAEIGNNRDVRPGAVFLDYSLTGMEETGTATLKMQYRFGGPSGTTLLLESPASVQFDGDILEPDSSRLLGAYYEVFRPVEEFAGRHQLIYTDADGKRYPEEIRMPLFALAEPLPDTLSRTDSLLIRLNGVQKGDVLKLLLTDTAAFSPGIERVDTIVNPEIILTPDELAVLKPGPVSLELYRESIRPLKSVTREGGRMFTSYSLRRQVRLR